VKHDCYPFLDRVTLGIPISIYVTPADMHDTRGARCLLAGLKFFVPRLKKIWADAASGTRGFSVVPLRWVVDRTFSWISRNRRMSKVYEQKVQTSETLIQLAMIRLLLAPLARHPRTRSPS